MSSEQPYANWHRNRMRDGDGWVCWERDDRQAYIYHHRDGRFTAADAGGWLAGEWRTFAAAEARIIMPVERVDAALGRDV